MADIGPLIGSPSKLTIFDEMGNLIVKEGEIITQSVVESARNAGKLDDLRMSAAIAQQSPEISEAGEYVEIGEEEPSGVHPE